MLDLVSQMFYQAMVSQHQALAEEAVTATSSFIISLEVPGVRHRMNDLLPHMISVMERERERERERDMNSCLIMNYVTSKFMECYC